MNLGFNTEYGIDEVKTISAKLITLNETHNSKNQWVKSRGARIEQHYTYSNTDSYIREYYSYTYGDGGRNISDYTRTIEWVDQVGLFYSEETTPELTSYHLREVNKSARNGQMDYMEGAASDLGELALTLPEPYKTGYLAISTGLETIMQHYKEEIREYRERNLYAYTFEDAVNNETDQTILDLLAMTVRVPDVLFPLGLTAKESIIHQLTGVEPV
jgi:hypothetical protein